MNVFKRFLSMLLVLCMLVSAFPMTTLAAETDSAEPTVAETTHETTVATEETTEVIEETAVATEAAEEATAEATEASEEATEATAEATEATEEATEATAEATEATEEAIDSVEKTVESDIALFAVNLGTKPADGTVTGQPFNDDASYTGSTTGHTNYRIPGIVMLDNGTLVASADIRYDYEYDGGGSDIVVSRSENNGATWNYSVVAYLGDQGNIHARNASTMMDPVLITDGTNLYLLYDMFPAGYSLAGGNNTTYAFSATGTGFDSQGRLLLGTTYNSTSCGYYLEKGKIYATDGTEQEGYTVDAWFNVSYNGTYVSNLFFVESPFYAYPTSYACIQTSTNGGDSWSDPEMLKTKHDGTAWQVLGPGSGIVTSSGELAFTVYNSDGSISLVHGTPGNWKTVKTFAATNESSVVELSDGTIRAFAKNNSNKITYVDFTKNGDSYTAGSVKTTNVSNTGWCMVSSLKYSKLINGKEAIFVCCPSSGSSVRSNGKIHVFTLDDSNNMTLLKSYEVNGNVFFAYSDMAELNGGSDIALLYEDGCMYYSQNNGVGYSHIAYTKLSVENVILSGLNVEITEIPPYLTDSTGSKVSDIFVKNGTTATCTIRNLPADATASAVSGDDTVVTASVTGDTLTLTGAGNGTATVTVTAGTYTLQLAVTVAATANDITVKQEVKDITVYVGQRYTDTIEGYAYTEENATIEDSSVATMTVTGENEIENGKKIKTQVTGTATFAEGKQYLIVNSRAAAADPTHSVLTATSYSSNGASWLGTLTGLDMNADSTENSAELWSITPSGNGYLISRNGSYLNLGDKTASMNTNPEVLTLTYATEGWKISDGTYYLSDLAGTSLTGAHGWNDAGDGGNYWTIYEISNDIAPAYTEVTFTGLKAGKTTATVGHVKYNITVEYKVKDIVLYVGADSKTVPVTGTVTADQITEFNTANASVVTVALSADGTEMTLTGVGVGIVSDAVLGNTKYNIQVREDIRDIHLYPDQTKTDLIKGIAYTSGTVADESRATLDSVNAVTVGGTKSLVPVTSIESGKQYLLVNTRANKTLTGTSQSPGLALNGEAIAENTNVWTIETSGNAYTVRYGTDGGYLTVGNTSAGLSNNASTVKLEYVAGDNYWRISNVDNSNCCLNDYQGGHETAAGWNSSSSPTDVGSRWLIYEVITTPGKPETEVTFTGRAEGTTTATVGHVKYNITVSWTIPITIYEGTAKTDILVGYQYTNADVKSMPDGSVAFIHAVETNSNGDTVVYFSGVAAGETTAKVGKFTYEIKVIPLSGTEDDTGDIEGFRSIVGIGTYSDGNASNLNMTGKEIKSLRISEGASFQLDVDVADYDSIVWSSADESIATVENGLVTAVAEGETMVSATVTKNGVTETISVAVTVVPSLVEGYTADQICPIFFYIEEVHDTDPYYTLFLTSESETEAVENHELVMVTEGEVIWLERPKSAGMAMIWTADPFDGTALTFMNATGSLAQYYPLQTADGKLGTGVDGTTEYYVGTDGERTVHNAYKNVIGVAQWTDALHAVLNKAILVGDGLWEEVGCDGAMSMSRNLGDNWPKLVSSLSFVSDKLPVLDKSINGILPATRLEKDFRTYTDGMTATVGELVYFNLTITLERPHIWADNNEAAGVAALQYSDAILSDLAFGDKAYFYTKELDRLDNGILDGTVDKEHQAQTLDKIEDDMNKAWGTDEKVRVLEYYVIYEIQPEDIANSEIINTADLNYNYQSRYSRGGKDAAANAEATLTVVGSTMSNVVIDFGQKVKIENVSGKALKYVTTDIFNTTYGKVTVSGNGDVREDDSGTYYDSYTVIYEPTSILQGPDVIQLFGTYNVDGTPITKVINGFTVYPATSVYYEEGFIFDSNSTGWNLDQAAKATMEQEYEPLGKAIYDDSGKLTDIISARVNPYGYDGIYRNSSTGSGSSFAESSDTGAETSFTFTGTGFELYANSNASSGYVTVYSKGKLNKLYMINTELSGSENEGDVTNDQQDAAVANATYYSLPIISETALPYGTYTVRIKQTNGDAPIYIDGVRIINTLEDSDIFTTDEEDNPVFYELRDYVLNAIGVEGLDKSAYIDPEEDADGQRDYDAMVDEVSQMAGQVYTALGTGTKAALITDYAIFGKLDTSTDMTEEEKAAYQQKVQDLLDNGPKNELYLYPGQTLVFSVTTPRVVQLGLKSPTGSAEFILTAGDTKVNIDGNAGDNETLTSTVDMFYKIAGKGEATNGKVFTIENTGASGVLSVTLLKICDDPNFNFNDLTKEDIEAALLSVYGLLNEDVPEEDETPSEPTEPDPTEPDATEPKPTEPDATEPEIKVEGVTRLAGADRLVTSYLAADQLKAKLGIEKFQNIIVASGGTFADALPGSYLSAVKNAPILLTLAKDKYVNQTAEYIKANLVEGGTVYILGGESAVPASMETALAGINVKRVAGADRFGTNLAILKEAGVKAGDEILVCTAKEFADSLSASATGKPILLVYKKITDEQKAYLATLSGCKFTVVGGTTAVPDSIAKEMETYGAVTRLAGKDRLETSTMVAEKYFGEAKAAVVAYGWNFPDGLCGGSLAYAMDAPLILAHSKEKLAQFTADYTTKAGLKVGYVLGGEGLVDDAATRAIFGIGSENITILK